MKTLEKYRYKVKGKPRQANLIPILVGLGLWNRSKNKKVAAANANTAAVQEELTYTQAQLDALQQQQEITSPAQTNNTSSLIMWLLIAGGIYLLFFKGNGIKKG